MEKNLTGKVIAVTGAFGSLGMAVANAAALRGAQVAMIDAATAPAIDQLPAALAIAHLSGGIDLTSAAAAQGAFTGIMRDLKRLDGLVNIAGAFRWETLEGGSLATWEFLYKVNVMTAATACKTALPYLLAQQGSRIVNIGAAAADRAGAGMGAYAASKSGVASLTEALAEENKDRGLTANAVLPSIIDTPPNRADMPDADFSRWVTPDALAEVIMFLLSDTSQAVTGALIPVRGRV